MDIEGFRYIPGLKKNLISISQLDITSYAAEFGKSSWKIVKGVMMVPFHLHVSGRR